MWALTPHPNFKEGFFLKTKKVLALLVLTAMIMSIVPAMAFGAINVDQSDVIVPTTGPIAAVSGIPNGRDDGQEFKVIVYDPDEDWDDFYVASSRPTVDHFFYAIGPNWYEVDYASAGTTTAGIIDAHMLAEIKGSDLAKELSLKVVSTAAGTSRIAFGLEGDGSTPATSAMAWGNTLDYALSRGGTDATLIIGGARYPVEFTSPRAYKITLASNATSGRYANNIDNYVLTATVVTQSEVPVSGQTVNFSIISGTGARLSASSATTNAAGRAVVFLYSSRQGDVIVRARTSVTPGDANRGFDDAKVNFGSTGIISIKAESKDDQKIARGDDPASFRISAYDVNGNRVDFTQLGILEADYGDVTNSSPRYIGDATATIEPKVLVLKAEVVKKPSGAALGAGNIYYAVHKNSGNLDIKIPFNYLNRDGEYTIKVYLVNGSSVSYTFNVKDQGDIIKLVLDYGATSFAAGSYLPEPGVISFDADDYSVYKPFSVYNAGAGNAALSISDASFMDGKLAANGSFKLKDDKPGSIYMTLVDKTLNLVARADLEIRKPASYLKLTAPTVTAVGFEATIDIQLVDIDGNLAAVGLGAKESSATVISSPEGAIASASSVDVSKFGDGVASVKVSSNVEGDVLIRVIITEVEKPVPGKEVYQVDGNGDFILDANGNKVLDQDLTEYYGGRTYTGPATVAFGKASDGGGTLIFIIGAPSFVTGTTPHAAESPAFIENGRTFLGVRDIGTDIGATIEWDQDTQTATISKDNITVKVTVGSDTIAITKAGVTTEVATDAAAVNKDGRVYLPFRVLLEAFGYTVTWDDATQSIICTI